MGWHFAKAAACLAAVFSLFGCGPRGDDPPSDSEMLTGLQGFWQAEIPAMSQALRRDYSGLLKPVGAKGVGNGISQDTGAGKMYAIQVAYSYQAQGPFTYACDPAVTMHLRIETDPAHPFPNSANSGDTVTCAGPVSFTKVDQGWIMNIGQGYLLKR